MPFQIVKRGTKYAVVTEGTGKVHGTFATRKQARGQLKALYANVPEARKSA
jgi:hypothetical protein